jgi:hypothetical protein
VADEAVPLHQTLREANLREDELLSCAFSKRAAAALRYRVLLPAQNGAIEVPAHEGLTAAALVASALGASVAGVLLMFRVGVQG